MLLQAFADAKNGSIVADAGVEAIHIVQVCAYPSHRQVNPFERIAESNRVVGVRIRIGCEETGFIKVVIARV